jgi:MoaA/NifB/PqqE/SkfB family radical SAM enzyme
MALPQPVVRDGPDYLTTRAPVAFGEGFYEEQVEHLDVYRWMGQTGRLVFAPDEAERYLECWVMSEFYDLSQDVTVEQGGRVDRLPLVHGWSPLSIAIAPVVDHVDLTLNKIFPKSYYPADRRTLGVRVRQPHLHRDGRWHSHFVRQHANAVHNVSEMLDGKARLESTPVTLGIDMYGACNVKPPCVYCEWDYSKDLEGAHVDTPFTVDTLTAWGPFFDNSVNLVNCSIGEPFMMKNLDDLLDAFTDGGKVLEVATNGQILTDRNIQRLLGRNIDLYISLDAGTPDTYRKLRNDRFDAILRNLRRLNEAKGGPGHLPRVHLVFMPMRVNVHEIEEFVRLAADLRVDRMVLRPLNYSDAISLDWDRAGYRFEYQKELLPFNELVRASGRADELCRRLGVKLADQMDFGGSMGSQFERWFEEGRREGAAALGAAPVTTRPAPVEATPAPVEATPEPAPESAVAPTVADDSRPAAPPALGDERVPLCTEPWKSLYILRRGVFPCCYGHAPVAPMDGHAEAWNSPLLQGIRHELAHGRFHDYCLRSPACPIVRKSQQAHELPRGQAFRLKARQLWTRLDRVGGGLPGKVYRKSRSLLRLAWRAVTEPSKLGYRTRILVKRVFGRDSASR